MRQIGGPLPERPPLEVDSPVATDASTASRAASGDEEMPPATEAQAKPLWGSLEPHEAQQPDPYPIEVHRIEHQPVDAAPSESVDSAPQPSVEPSEEPSPEPAAIEPAPEPVSTPRVEETISTPPWRPPANMRPASQTTIAAAPPPPDPAAVRKEPTELRIVEAPPELNLASGRWEEFSEFPRTELRRGGGVNRDPRPPLPISGWGLGAEYEPERRSSFSKIALVVVVVLIAAGAVLWSGYLRDRMSQQDEEVSALKDQNRKLAQSLVSVSSSHEDATPGAPSPASPATTSPAPPTASSPAPPANGQPGPSQPSAPAPSSGSAPATAKADATASTSNQPAQSGASREGVATPPPQPSVAKKDSRRPVDANYHPEIVPPYPTLSQSQSPTGAPASGNPMPAAQTYHQPFTVGSSATPAGSSSTASAHATPPQSTSRPASPQPTRVISTTSQSSAPAYSTASNGAYSATSNEMYASALAENIEAVASLQRQSTVPLREFHARAGALSKVVPGVTVSVQSPDEARGTYALVVNGGGTSYQLRGHVDSALAFTDNSTHRVYELMVLHITGGEAYGYVRPAQQ